MYHSVLRRLILIGLLAAGVRATAADSASNAPVFRALPRSINYATPLNPAGGPRAVIVYGRVTPGGRAAAEAVQKALRDWSGITFDLVDDRVVTSDETWLLTDAYLKTPLVVLGNAQDNRALHALGTRFLLRSNRSWPGGDRYILRTVIEPFVADVNWLVLEASTPAGLDAAARRLAELLPTFPADAKTTARLPARLRDVGSGKDPWRAGAPSWKPPEEWTRQPDASVAERVRTFTGAPILAGTPAHNARLLSDVCNYMMGGLPGPARLDLEPAQLRDIAAMVLLGCRAQKGRTHGYYDHYGALHSQNGIRALIQSGVLSDSEVNELESSIVLSSALPLDYVYNAFHYFDRVSGNRHSQASFLSTAHAIEYALTHCRMDEPTRRELERRYDRIRKTAVLLARSFRDMDDTDMLGENTLMQVASVLHQGLMEVVRSGTLRRSADLYTLCVDNMPGRWGCDGQYVGLSGFSSAPEHISMEFFGGGLVEQAAFYYNDPQYRWLANHWADIKWSRGAGYLPMYTDTVGPMEKPNVPATYDGVRMLPYDRVSYEWLTDQLRRNQSYRLPPEPFEKAADRLAFRDDFHSNAAFLYLSTSSHPWAVRPIQNNMLARFTDLADTWLYTNVKDNSGWVRNLVSISNGRNYIPRAGCTIEALANLGEVSAAASREQGVAGMDWTRTVVHWRGHYFVVLDRMVAQADDDYVCVCRWRCPQMAALRDGIWTAMAPSGNRFYIQNTEPLLQTAEYWPIDGSGRPYVLQQYHQGHLARGTALTFQNLMYVAGAARPDEFAARRVTGDALLVKGRTSDGEHLALIGVNGGIPLADFETDAQIYHVVGDRLHLAGLTSLKARIGDAFADIFHADQPVNLLVECASGAGEIEVRGEAPVRVRAGVAAAKERQPGRGAVVLAAAGALPRPSAAVAALWDRSAPHVDREAKESSRQPDPFVARIAPTALRRPQQRLTNARITSTPRPNYEKRTRRTWDSTKDLEITFSLPESQPLDCLRVIAANTPPQTVAGRDPTLGEWVGTEGSAHRTNDMEFSLVLSDDGFQEDVRLIERPRVTIDQTSYPPDEHSTMQHYLTWRIEIGQSARQVKLLPRATAEDRPQLDLRDLEIYGAAQTDDLEVKACVADLDGDGSNALVVGTSMRELAAYGADGRTRWVRHYPADILKMETADLETDGRAETILYLTNEEVRRVNGDGSERRIGDVLQAEKEVNHGHWGVMGIHAMTVWAPDSEKAKEVLLLAEGPYRVLADGTVQHAASAVGNSFGVLGCGRLTNLYPGEPEVMVFVRGRSVHLMSARRDENGSFIKLGWKPQVAGQDGGKLGWVQAIDWPEQKGFLTAYQGGVNFYPLDVFLNNPHGPSPADANTTAWEFGTSGVPAVAALLEDLDGDGAPELYLARLDGFINVLNLADGKERAKLSTGEPILGLCALRGRDGKLRLAVGTKFSVQLFGPDLRPAGRHPILSVAFAGPGGPNRDRAFAIGGDGRVTVLTLP